MRRLDYPTTSTCLVWTSQELQSRVRNTSKERCIHILGSVGWGNKSPSQVPRTASWTQISSGFPTTKFALGRIFS